jgi:hypothetical protein
MRKRRILVTLAVVAVFLVGLVFGFVVAVARQPADYRVTRSATMAAPASVVFDQVNDFHHWDAWSPWAKLDPKAKNSFEGSESGTGAIFRWNGNDKVGEGSLTILKSIPNELVRMKLEFIRPFPDSCITEVAFEPAGQHTSVNWSMLGRHPNFTSKAICTVMNMDKMIGRDFEKGLANIKAIVEAKGSGPAPTSSEAEAKTEN